MDSFEKELLMIEETYDEEIERAAHAQECKSPTPIDRADFFCHLARDARAELERVKDRGKVNAAFAVVAFVRDAHFRADKRRHVACCLCDAVEVFDNA